MAFQLNTRTSRSWRIKNVVNRCHSIVLHSVLPSNLVSRQVLKLARLADFIETVWKGCSMALLLEPYSVGDILSSADVLRLAIADATLFG